MQVLLPSTAWYCSNNGEKEEIKKARCRGGEEVKKKSPHQNLSACLSARWYLALDISAVLPVHKTKQEDIGMAENKIWCT